MWMKVGGNSGVMMGGGEDVLACHVLSNHRFGWDWDGWKGFHKESDRGRFLVAITGVAMGECTDVKKMCTWREIVKWYRQAAKGETRNPCEVSSFSVRVINNKLKSPQPVGTRYTISAISSSAP
jgi:hypothetical protein